jgi:hypothetical protein
MAPDVVHSRYPLGPAFADLARTFDPDGTFRNDFVAAHVLG